MKKRIRSLAYLFLIAFLSHISIFAHTTSGRLRLESNIKDKVCLSLLSTYKSATENKDFAPLAPTVISPIYLCQNSVATALTATASTGATLIWYGIAATGGTGSPIAPIPSTTNIGQTKYYVSQSDGTGESPRAEIVVNVVADNGSAILNLRCDPTQIAAADKNSSVFFDWSNTPGLPNQYTYSYSVEGGPAVTGTTGPTNLQVFSLLPGQSVTLTVWHTTYPCDRSEFTCVVPCGTATVTPNFAAIAPICAGSIPPVLGPMSPNNISGTWSPAIVSNTATGNYVFTPNSVLFPCATTQTLTVTVIPLATPVFATVPSTVCQNATAPILPISSTNATPISGTWSPATINTSTSGPANYVFTANPGQCVTSPTTTFTITVNQNVIPTFTAVPAICSGATLSPLPTTSTNGITGNWSPSLNNTATTTYTFSPTVGQCATTATMTITVRPNGTPTFTAVAAICTGAPLSPLPTTSNNGYTGTWSPALDNTNTTTYTFTPDSGQCAATSVLTITVNQLRTPIFSSIPTTVCENSVAPTLPLSSSNTSAITGTWSPAIVNTAVVGPADYIFTPDNGQCSDELTVSIRVDPSNTLVDFSWTVTEAFSENQVITVAATGAGDYLYQLDDGPFQQSPIFEYLSPGYHSVTVQDITGCSASITKNDILVIGYPKFFTPNNDGYNDYWNVSTLVDKLGSKIQIFDRYGKLLKEIDPNSNGWNGTYNGRPLPATDYWFVVDYPEDGIIKKFRSHFSLKR
jgi:gliding motility-associated-like protein